MGGVRPGKHDLSVTGSRECYILTPKNWVTWYNILLCSTRPLQLRMRFTTYLFVAPAMTSRT